MMAHRYHCKGGLLPQKTSPSKQRRNDISFSRTIFEVFSLAVEGGHNVDIRVGCYSTKRCYEEIEFENFVNEIYLRNADQC